MDQTEGKQVEQFMEDMAYTRKAAVYLRYRFLRARIKAREQKALALLRSKAESVGQMFWTNEMKQLQERNTRLVKVVADLSDKLQTQELRDIRDGVLYVNGDTLELRIDPRE
jgi:predicted NAD/FAD-binding protein